MITKKLIPFSRKEYPFEFNSTVSFLENCIKIDYIITGDISSIVIEKCNATPQRLIGLWKKTCFEFFLRSGKYKEYMEFNFSSSLNWNCFNFNSETKDLTEWNIINTPKVKIVKTEDRIEMNVIIEKVNLALAHQDFKKSEYSTTAVLLIEDEKGDIIETFWAIKHADMKPNFHHPESYQRCIDKS